MKVKEGRKQMHRLQIPTTPFRIGDTLIVNATVRENYSDSPFKHFLNKKVRVVGIDKKYLLVYLSDEYPNEIAFAGRFTKFNRKRKWRV
jgi:hypothetical protein